MAFTGDLENLPIVDIIQLVHTTRRSGIFSVKSDKGESRIVFSSGYIVGANHINDRVRIGSVLVKMGAITIDDLKEVLKATQAGGEDHMPLVTALILAGKLKREDALKGLKKLVEMTIVELIGWSKGTFTFDTDAVIFSAEAASSSEGIAEDVVLDAQMVLMDAMRVFDERERDRASGKEVPAFEEIYGDVLPGEGAAAPKPSGSAITADVLGLADLDRLEKKIPRPFGEMELFDPLEIHRQKIRELLPEFSKEELEAFVSFLKRASGRKASPDAAAQQAGKAVVLFSSDRLLTHSVMTLCKEDGVPVFATEGEKDLDSIIAQCLSSMHMPVVVFDGPAGPLGGAMEEEALRGRRNRVREQHPAVPMLQLCPSGESDFALRSYRDGAWAVLPKPSKETRKGTYVRDMIGFLEAFTSYVRSFQYRPHAMDRYLKELKKDMRALREIANPSDAALVMLAAVADMFERAITFIVRPAELAGERAVGVSTEKSFGPTAADRLRIALAKPSVFRDVIEKGRVYYGESKDEALQGLFRDMGEPLSRTIALLPVVSDRKVVAVIYGDFGKKEAAPVPLDILEVLAVQVGISLEYALYRRQTMRAAPKA